MELLTVKEVARRLRVSGSLIYQLIESERLGCHRIGNGRGAIRIRSEDVDHYLSQCRHDQARPPLGPTEDASEHTVPS